MDLETWRAKEFVQSDSEASFFMRFHDSLLLELKTINSEIEEADSPPSQSDFERLRDSLLSVVESINFETGDRDLFFGGLHNSLLSALKTISEVDSPRSQLIFERLQLGRRFQYLDTELIRKRSPPSQLLVLDRLPQAQAIKLYLYFCHSFGRIAYTLYEIQLPNPLYYPPTKATQDAEIRNPSPNCILELETSKYPDGMCCVQLSSGLYFFGGKFNIDKPGIGEDEKARRNVLPRDVYVFNFTLYNNCPDLRRLNKNNCPDSLRRLNKDMLLQLAPMNSGKASPQAFVVHGEYSEQIYVIGSRIRGLDDKDLAYFEVYDTSTDSWTVLPDLKIWGGYITWVGNAVVGSEAFFVGMKDGRRSGYCFDLGERRWTKGDSVYCFDLGVSQWTKEFIVRDSPYLHIFSGKTEFLKNGFYGCYRNTVVKLAVTESELRMREAVMYKVVEVAEEEEEGGEEEDGFYQVETLLCKYKGLLMVSKGMDAIYNVPRQLQSSTTLLHLGGGYFCYVRTGKPPPQIHDDEVDDDDLPSNRDRFTSIVIFRTAPSEPYEEYMATFFQAQFVYSIPYTFYSRFGEDVCIKGCYAEPLG